MADSPRASPVPQPAPSRQHAPQVGWLMCPINPSCPPNPCLTPLLTGPVFGGRLSFQFVLMVM
jgi:hypothetical protein